MSTNGYGTINRGGTPRGGKKRYVHRWVYSRLNGGFRGIHGKEVLHLCDNKLCYRYDHLWCGTHQDNMDDMKAKGRRGGGRRKLTEQEVREIRESYHGQPQRVIADQYGIGQTHVSQILRRQSWAWVQ